MAAGSAKSPIFPESLLTVPVATKRSPKPKLLPSAYLLIVSNMAKTFLKFKASSQFRDELAGK